MLPCRADGQEICDDGNEQQGQPYEPERAAEAERNARNGREGAQIRPLDVAVRVRGPESDHGTHALIERARLDRTDQQHLLFLQEVLQLLERLLLQARHVHLRDVEPLGDLGL